MRIRRTWNVFLTPELEALTDGRGARRRHRSAAEAVRATLRLLEADERGREPSAARARTTRRGRTCGR